MNRIAKRGTAVFPGVLVALVLGLLVGCNATEPYERTCSQSGFSNDGKRDSVWQVSCD
jgi:hypothetical protein